MRATRATSCPNDCSKDSCSLLLFFKPTRHYFSIWILLNVTFYARPKRCLVTFLYSLCKSSLLLAQAIHRLMGKDHVLPSSDSVILLGDIWYMPSVENTLHSDNEGWIPSNYLPHVLHADSAISHCRPWWKVCLFFAWWKMSQPIWPIYIHFQSCISGEGRSV